MAVGISHTQQSFSTKTLSLKRRVVLKGKSLKKIKEEVVDYRLGLNKKKQ